MLFGVGRLPLFDVGTLIVRLQLEPEIPQFERRREPRAGKEFPANQQRIIFVVRVNVLAQGLAEQGLRDFQARQIQASGQHLSQFPQSIVGDVIADEVLAVVVEMYDVM